jgi:outer membrane protein TolC
LTAASYNPTIAAEFIGTEIANVNAFLPRQVGVAGLSLSWEPFTWGRRRHDVAVARMEAERAANAEQDVKSQVAMDAVEQWRRLKLASARLNVADLSRKLAAESLRVAQKQYSVEFALLKTVLEAQSKLEAANADYQKASGELWSARADYERAEGLDR